MSFLQRFVLVNQLGEQQVGLGQHESKITNETIREVATEGVQCEFAYDESQKRRVVGLTISALKAPTFFADGAAIQKWWDAMISAFTTLRSEDNIRHPGGTPIWKPID